MLFLSRSCLRPRAIWAIFTKRRLVNSLSTVDTVVRALYPSFSVLYPNISSLGILHMFFMLYRCQIPIRYSLSWTSIARNKYRDCLYIRLRRREKPKTSFHTARGAKKTEGEREAKLVVRCPTSKHMSPRFRLRSFGPRPHPNQKHQKRAIRVPQTARARLPNENATTGPGSVTHTFEFRQHVPVEYRRYPGGVYTPAL